MLVLSTGGVLLKTQSCVRRRPLLLATTGATVRRDGTVMASRYSIRMVCQAAPSTLLTTDQMACCMACRGWNNKVVNQMLSSHRQLLQGCFVLISVNSKINFRNVAVLALPAGNQLIVTRTQLHNSLSTPPCRSATSCK